MDEASLANLLAEAVAVLGILLLAVWGSSRG